MPADNSDPAVRTFRAYVDGELVERTARRISAAELKRMRRQARDEQIAAEEVAKAKRVSNVVRGSGPAETVDVDEIRKTVKERKAERAAMKPTAEGKRREADLAATVENERERLANESVSGGE